MRGIRRDRGALLAYVKVRGVQRAKRFPLDTPLKKIHDWRDEKRVALKAAVPKRITPGSFRTDAAKYLALQKHLASYNSRVCEIEPWIRVFGDLPRSAITRQMILETRQSWLTDTDDPKAPKTCNHRVRALRHFYRFTDGRGLPTPCDDVPKLKEPDPDPRFVSPAKIRSVAKKLPDAKTRARFMVLAATGQRPAQLRRALKTDVDLRRRVWFVRPAKGGQPIPVILTNDMIAAWKAFAKANAWGHFDGSDYAKALYAAGWPQHIRPYNAKHTVAITLGESEADWEDIKDWFGHKDVKTTRIYTGVVLKRFRRTAARLEGRLGWK